MTVALDGPCPPGLWRGIVLELGLILHVMKPDYPSTDKGERIYAIGDIHGRYDLLKEMLGLIRAHHEAREPVSSLHIVLLGDLIDRGPDSARVLQWIYNVQQRSPGMIVLSGNHEDLMVRSLNGDAATFRVWMRTGGDATLRSFGIEPPERDVDPRLAIKQLRAEVPRNLLSWVSKLPLTARSGDYLFCHAGIRPGVALSNQKRADLLWIRDEFLGDADDHGVVVVHGHSIAEEVEMMDNRIGIDTGAYKTGRLTAVYLEGSEREILTATGRPMRAVSGADDGF